MSYAHYQNAAPGWGTNQGSWGGMDYFQAHATNGDPTLYTYARNKLSNYDGSQVVGVGKHEARRWHRVAYAGLGHISQMLPAELGDAAAYEAYRIWIYNTSIYQPLGSDIARQREGIVGLAIAEATCLSGYAGRTADRYSQLEACDAAAASAGIIFNEYQSRTAGQTSGDYSNAQGATNPATMNPYGFDEAIGAENPPAGAVGATGGPAANSGAPISSTMGGDTLTQSAAAASGAMSAAMDRGTGMPSAVGGAWHWPMPGTSGGATTGGATTGGATTVTVPGGGAVPTTYPTMEPHNAGYSGGSGAGGYSGIGEHAGSGVPAALEVTAAQQPMVVPQDMAVQPESRERPIHRIGGDH